MFVVYSEPIEMAVTSNFLSISFTSTETIVRPPGPSWPQRLEVAALGMHTWENVIWEIFNFENAFGTNT